MAARRCSICALDFPNTSEFAVCPVCDSDTSPFSNITAMPLAEARALKPLDTRYAFKDLTPAQRREVEADWAALAAEAARRPGVWTIADVFGEGGGPEPTVD